MDYPVPAAPYAMRQIPLPRYTLPGPRCGLASLLAREKYT